MTLSSMMTSVSFDDGFVGNKLDRLVVLLILSELWCDVADWLGFSLGDGVLLINLAVPRPCTSE